MRGGLTCAGVLVPGDREAGGGDEPGAPIGEMRGPGRSRLTMGSGERPHGGEPPAVRPCGAPDPTPTRPWLDRAVLSTPRLCVIVRPVGRQAPVRPVATPPR